MVRVESGADGCYEQDLRVELEPADPFAELPATLERSDPNVAALPVEDQAVAAEQHEQWLPEDMSISREDQADVIADDLDY